MRLLDAVLAALAEKVQDLLPKDRLFVAFAANYAWLLAYDSKEVQQVFDGTYDPEGTEPDGLEAWVAGLVDAFQALMGRTDAVGLAVWEGSMNVYEKETDPEGVLRLLTPEEFNKVVVGRTPWTEGLGTGSVQFDVFRQSLGAGKGRDPVTNQDPNPIGAIFDEESKRWVLTVHSVPQLLEAARTADSPIALDDARPASGDIPTLLIVDEGYHND